MQEYTIHPLVVGINETDQGVMTYLRDYGKRIYLPIYVFYLSGGDKNILVDTGLEQFMIPEGAEEQCGYQILEFEDALATVDLKAHQALTKRRIMLLCRIYLLELYFQVSVYHMFY